MGVLVVTWEIILDGEDVETDRAQLSQSFRAEKREEIGNDDPMY